MKDFSVSITVDSHRLVSGNLVDANPTILEMEKQYVLRELQTYVARMTIEDVKVTRVTLLEEKANEDI